MKPAMFLAGAGVVGGIIGLAIAYAFEKVLGDPWYR